MIRSAWFLTFAALGGCGFIVNVDGERTPGPDAPTIHIEPEAPRTLDDLHVVVDAESVDPRGAAVEYEYAWRRNETAAGSEATVPHLSTTKHETWEVTVTPVADGRRGMPAVASVVIANSEPVLSSISLSRYDPFPDEALEAILGRAEDADGDSIAYEHTWIVNGLAIASRARTLDLSSLALAPGSTVALRVVPSDDDSTGLDREAGPARVRPEGAQWRQILPQRDSEDFNDGPIRAVYDPVRNSVICFPLEQVWEFLVAERRWVRLSPTNGDPPATQNLIYTDVMPILDHANRRILFVNLARFSFLPTVNQVRALDISVPGREAWSSITLAPGDVPAMTRTHAAAMLDAKRNRILLYGGRCEDPSTPARFCDDLWAIHLDPGNERWERITNAAGIGAPVGATFILDEARDRAFLLGGTRPTAGTPNAATVPSSDVFLLDLATTTFSTSPVAQSPASATFAGATTLPGTREAYVFHGATAFAIDAPQPAIWRFDLDSFSFTAIDLSGDEALLHPSTWPEVVYDEEEERIVVVHRGAHFRGVTRYDPELAITSVRRDGSVVAIEAPGATTPRALANAVARIEPSGAMMLSFGRSGNAEAPEVEGGSFSLPVNGSVDVIEPNGDVRPRFGAATTSSTFDQVVFGGSSVVEGVPTVVTDAWVLGAEWRGLGVFTGVDATFGGAWMCGTQSGFVLAGSSATPLSSFSCAAGACTLTPLSITLPSIVGASVVRLWNPIVTFSTTVIIGAGDDGSQILTRMNCTPDGTFATQPIADVPDLRTATSFLIDADDEIIVAGRTWETSGVRYAAGVINLPGDTFTNVATIDTAVPRARQNGVVAWDESRRRLLLYGGTWGTSGSDQSSFLSDYWELRYPPPP